MPRLRERLRNLFALLRAYRVGLWSLLAVGVGLLIGAAIYVMAGLTHG